MKHEIVSAANFLVQLLRLQAGTLTEGQLQSFKTSLTDVLARRYREHWFPDRPNRGSGYRCIRINGKMDPVIAQAGAKVGLLPNILHGLFPSELTMWIDPAEVSYRIGENGSICVLFDASEQPEPEVKLPPVHHNNHHHRHQQQHHQQMQHHHHSSNYHHHHHNQNQHHQNNNNNNNHQQHHHHHHHHTGHQQQQQQFESCKDSLLLEHTQFNEQIAAFVSS